MLRPNFAMNYSTTARQTPTLAQLQPQPHSQHQPEPEPPNTDTASHHIATLLASVRRRHKSIVDKLGAPGVTVQPPLSPLLRGRSLGSAMDGAAAAAIPAEQPAPAPAPPRLLTGGGPRWSSLVNAGLGEALPQGLPERAAERMAIRSVSRSAAASGAGVGSLASTAPAAPALGDGGALVPPLLPLPASIRISGVTQAAAAPDRDARTQTRCVHCNAGPFASAEACRATSTAHAASCPRHPSNSRGRFSNAPPPPSPLASPLAKGQQPSRPKEHRPHPTPEPQLAATSVVHQPPQPPLWSEVKRARKPGGSGQAEV
eukprot:COSAG01_NODE_16320_length_1246_cov_30.169137_1_plen_315_part_01